MTYFKSSQEWLDQSTLLLQARPTSARITTKYTITKPKSRTSKDGSAASNPSSSVGQRARLVVKTYDPVSGAALKYKTTKAAEVSRLVFALGRLGRSMAALPEIEATAPADAAEAKLAGVETGNAGTGEARGGGSGGGVSQPSVAGGGGKKKKKGKK